MKPKPLPPADPPARIGRPPTKVKGTKKTLYLDEPTIQQLEDIGRPFHLSISAVIEILTAAFVNSRPTALATPLETFGAVSVIGPEAVRLLKLAGEAKAKNGTVPHMRALTKSRGAPAPAVRAKSKTQQKK